MPEASSMGAATTIAEEPKKDQHVVELTHVNGWLLVDVDGEGWDAIRIDRIERVDCVNNTSSTCVTRVHPISGGEPVLIPGLTLSAVLNLILAPSGSLRTVCALPD